MAVFLLTSFAGSRRCGQFHGLAVGILLFLCLGFPCL